ncbi:MAG: SPFH domain-containing protein, partial [Sphingopyxis sp.]
MTDISNRGDLNASSERGARTFGGYLMLLLFVTLFALIVWRTIELAQDLEPSVLPGLPDTSPLGFAIATVLRVVILILIASGFFMLQPNQAAVITLFGAYRGTDRHEGLRWIWPWMGKAKVSARSNNVISDKIKVNDLRGNPIEIAAQVVWRVTDTAQALFDVDDYKAFVMAQIEAAVRTIGSRYPYDDIEHKEVTLRGNHDEVGA